MTQQKLKIEQRIVRFTPSEKRKTSENRCPNEVIELNYDS